MKLILVLGLLGVECGCATHDALCSTALRPINVATTARARVPPAAEPPTSAPPAAPAVRP